MERKLQVFISSTYLDLKEERLEAMQSILGAGHIPTGMEFWNPTNDTQLKLIHDSIDSSNIYILIIGGRYGSVEENTGKSYTQIEYEYAIEKGKDIFTLFLSENFISSKIANGDLTEKETKINKKAFDEFLKTIKSTYYAPINELKDIAIVIPQTLNEIMSKSMFGGWVRDSRCFLETINTKMEDVDSYVSKRIQTAKHSVKGLTWRDNYQITTNNRRNEFYRKKMQEQFVEDLLNLQPDIDVMEVFTFPDVRENERIQAVKALLKRRDYQCGFYPKNQAPFPKIHFVIIDDEEVIFVSSQYSPFNFATKDEYIVRIFKHYYSDIWKNCIKLKDNNVINKNNQALMDSYWRE